ncbi:MAG TPA: FeoA domain-containing protein [Anaerolineae bacterium]|nr:FeoA domain-containing protein [Anaerolineae bacterium]
MPDPLIALLFGCLFISAGAILFWPNGGLFSRWQRMRQLSSRVLREDALKHIHEAEQKGQPATLQSVAGALYVSANQAAALLVDMQEHEWVTLTGGVLRLTPAGRDVALHVIRAHRLWERHLAEDTSFAEAEWHPLAERREHELSSDEADALSARLGHPTHDPHGDPIPTASGEWVPHGGRPLTALSLDETARIVHLEDEPETVYAQLVAEGLYPGQTVRLIENSPQRVRFWANGDPLRYATGAGEHVLAPIVADNISVAPMRPEAAVAEPAGEPLHALKPGEKGAVVRISPRCRGSERRRLMDLGLLPGTIVEAELVSPGGDPTAYRVRGAVIALRKEQAQFIHITRTTEATP